MSSTHNLMAGLRKLGLHADVKPATLFKLLDGSCPSLTKSKLGRISNGYAWATWTEVLAIAAALKADPYELSGAPRPPNVAERVTPLPSPSPKAPPAPTPAPAPHPMPPAELPAQGSQPIETYRQVLGKDLLNARNMLHVPKLPAANWAAWRAFEKRLLAQIASLKE